MSWNPSLDPVCPDAVAVEAIETLIVTRARDIGGFEVRRALPAPKRQMVWPFIFFDQMGPADFISGQGVDVRPHPHIGLAAVTYNFRGEFQHRDSLGSNVSRRCHACFGGSFEVIVYGELRRGVHRRIRFDDGGVVGCGVPAAPVGQFGGDEAGHGGP